MAAAGNDRNFRFYSPYAQQKYSSISCFWETQPSGCVRISCAFHHSKPRTINGLFLPPSNNTPLQLGVQEGILSPAHCGESLRNQENILRPIHPPLVINFNDEEEEEDEEEENSVPNWVPKSAEDIEEERAIKEICYKSGEYYRIQYPPQHQSTKNVSSPRENELLPLEATKRDLQKESNHTELVKDRQCKEVKKKWISEETRNSPDTVTVKGIHTSDRKVKPRYQQRGQSKNDETVRETGKKTYFNFSEPRRSPYIVYRTATVTQEPKFKGSTDKYTSGSYNSPTWRKRNPHAKTFSKFKTISQEYAPSTTYSDMTHGNSIDFNTIIRILKFKCILTDHSRVVSKVSITVCTAACQIDIALGDKRGCKIQQDFDF
ncbi:PREDICTED: uncharacterized protein C12orf50 homolog [Charadrius vociferus]|uniref:uncharacterized protein C12orf50 homolog n=1 Tax=Charadrius vociferus TaxID=50402 RepID=UPI000521C35F|nr:PREDICTED: uncharacterized protein C12orf50 homolog [Charadrius vociferus]